MRGQERLADAEAARIKAAETLADQRSKLARERCLPDTVERLRRENHLAALVWDVITGEGKNARP
jgi:hypothetical protein